MNQEQATRNLSLSIKYPKIMNSIACDSFPPVCTFLLYFPHNFVQSFDIVGKLFGYQNGLP